jgi:hypothetical protein
MPVEMSRVRLLDISVKVLSFEHAAQRPKYVKESGAERNLFSPRRLDAHVDS